MKVIFDATGSSDYGDTATVRFMLTDDSWIEVSAADAHNVDGGPSAGGYVEIRHANGYRERVWDGVVWGKHDLERKADPPYTSYASFEAPGSPSKPL